MGVVRPAQSLEAVLARAPAHVPGFSALVGRDARLDPPRQAGLDLRAVRVDDVLAYVRAALSDEKRGRR